MGKRGEARLDDAGELADRHGTNFPLLSGLGFLFHGCPSLLKLVVMRLKKISMVLLPACGSRITGCCPVMLLDIDLLPPCGSRINALKSFCMFGII